MVDLKHTIGKLFRSREISSDDVKKGLTPDEVELRWFEERERLRAVKKKLEMYRKKESRSLILGENPLTQPPTILQQKNTFNDFRYRRKKRGG